MTDRHVRIVPQSELDERAGAAARRMAEAVESAIIAYEEYEAKMRERLNDEAL